MHHARVDALRGTRTERGYGTAHSARFRAGVLARDDQTCQMCGGFADVADHHPLSRRELVAAGLDADDPQYGRALCVYCHNRHTGRTQGHGNLGKAR
ncbi:holin [Nocardia brasiliensis]|uniref:Holin n=1 Tax=Nocardia brasiliensis TaxID=37326 RepID=A0A6G9Y0X9_NOCBR|nr:holin [Nocardia brasiliensis]QIS06776.1 holin [Nocardia brasiliensis]